MVMKVTAIPYLVSLLLLVASDAFLTSPTRIHLVRRSGRQPSTNRQANFDFGLAATTTKTTLDEQTTWDLRFLLQSVPTEQGKKADNIFSAKVQFIEEVGYEPPQGDLKQIFTVKGGEPQEESESQFRILSSRWQLSEDPNERKDGLWIWGLFAEPLYPFLLLQLEVERIPLPGEGDDAIVPLKLYSIVNHKREKESGVLLSGGDLSVKEAETFNADPFGAASVTVYDDVAVGKLQIQPSSNKN